MFVEWLIHDDSFYTYEDVQFGWRLQHVHTYIYMYVFIGVERDVYLAIYSIHMMMNNSCGDCRYVPNLHTYKHICTNKYVQYICPHKLPCVGTCFQYLFTQIYVCICTWNFRWRLPRPDVIISVTGEILHYLFEWCRIDYWDRTFLLLSEVSVESFSYFCI